MSNEIRIRHIQNLEEFESLRSQWDGLLESRPRKTIFLTWEWLTAWWKHYRGNRELWLITAWDGDNLMGAAPLMKTNAWKYGLCFRLLHSLGSPNCDESDFLIRNDSLEIAKALCDYLYEQHGQWDALELNEFESKTATCDLILDYFNESGCVIHANANFHYHIPIQSVWDVYWKKLSKNLRHNIERRLRRAQELHQVDFKYIHGNQLTWDHFETIFEVSRKGNFPGKYKSSRDQGFHRELLNQMKDHNWIEMAFLYLDGQAIAFEYGFNLNGRFEDWRTGFDLSHAELAGGTLLVHFLLQHLCSHGYSELDFLRGEYDFKEKWLPKGREFTELRIVQPHRLSARLALIWIPNLWHRFKEKYKPKQKSEKGIQ